MMMKIAVDGSFREGRMHYGILAEFRDKYYEFWGATTRHPGTPCASTAELWAVVHAMVFMRPYATVATSVHIFSDDETMIQKINNPETNRAYHLRPLHLKIAKLADTWDKTICPIYFHHVPREENYWPHSLASRSGYGSRITDIAKRQALVLDGDPA